LDARKKLMNNTPLVSILMNCYNGDRFLKDAIDSVYSQTYSNWEIIFWDNASTDSSSKIALSYDEKLKYFLATKNTPLGEARSLALNEVSGKYVAFLDCDDLYFPKKTEKQVRLMEENEYVISYGSAVTINEYGKEIMKVPVNNCSGYIFDSLLNHYEINMQSVMLLNSYLIENELEFDNNFKYCPDHNLFMQIASHKSVGVVKDFIVSYRKVQNSLSKNTLSIAGSEVRVTLDDIATRHPELREKFNKEFNQAYGKSEYYDVIASINNKDIKQARKKMKPLIFLKYKYFLLYLLLFLPLSNKIILKILKR